MPAALINVVSGRVRELQHAVGQLQKVMSGNDEDDLGDRADALLRDRSFKGPEGRRFKETIRCAMAGQCTHHSLRLASM